MMSRLTSLMAAAVMSAPLAAAADDVTIRFTLDWKIQGVHSWFYLAEQKGYFEEAGLDVIIDQG